MERRELFKKMFSTFGREELAGNLPRMRSIMMDMGFDEKDVNIQWYLGEAAPEALADVICRRTVDLDRAADELSARTRLDRDKLRSYLGDVVG